MTTAADTKKAWEAVGDRLEALGLKLKLHFEEAGGQPAEEVGEAFSRLGSAIESAFAAVGTAVHDPAVREDASALADALGEALADSLSLAGQEVATAAKGLRCEGDKAENELSKGPDKP